MPKTSSRVLGFFILATASFFLNLAESQAQTCAVNSGILTCDGTNAGETIEITGCSITQPGCLAVNGNDFSPVTGGVIINGLGGNDVFRVNIGFDFIDNGPPPIFFDGGSGADNLFVFGSPDNPVDNSVHDPGPGAFDGRWTLTQDLLIAPVLDLQFAGVEALQDSTTVSNVIINGTSGDNAINYQDNTGDFFGVGSVSVDGFSNIQFNNQSVLVLDGLGGDDTFNVNNPNDDPPSNLTQITIRGGDPTASDTVILNGTGGAENITVTLTGPDSATVTGLPEIPVSVSTSELLVINGQGGQDSLHFVTAAGDQLFVLNTGAEIDSGSVQTTDSAIGANLIPVQFKNLGIAGFVVFDGGSGVNKLTVRTTEGDDSVNVATVNVNEADIERNIEGVGHLPVFTLNIPLCRIETLGGNDFVLAQANGGSIGRLEVEGGGDSDHLLLFGGTDDITIDLEEKRLTEGGFFLMEYHGFEEGEVSVQNFDLSITGGGLSEVFRYKPSTANGGLFEAVGQNMPWQITGAASLSLNGLGGTSDALIVEATPGNDTVTLQNASPQVTIAGLLPASISNIELLTVNGLSGDDTFSAKGLSNTSVVIDGGVHAAGDTLNFDGQGLSVSATPSSFTATGLKPVSYFNIENVSAINSTFNPPAPGGSVQFNAAVFRNLENDGFATISVERTGDGLGEVSVDFATSDGTALSGTDYTAASGTLTWGNGVTGEKTFQVPLIDNDLQDDSRAVKLTLSNLVAGDSAVTGTPTEADLLILDDETPAPVNPPNNSGDDGGCSLNRGTSSPSGFGLFAFFLAPALLSSLRPSRKT